MEELVSLRRLEQILGWNRESLRRFAQHAGRYYRPFDRRRQKGTGKWRHIDNPTDNLKELQRRIEKRILNRVPLPATMMGAVSGRSIRDNATRHLDQSMVVALDLRACFPRTSDLKVFTAYRTRVGCSTEIASLLTKLTTLQGRLPQGAPTSATLANLTLLPLHADMEPLMAKLGLQFTFWVDDIAISGFGAEEAIEPVIRLIHKHGHSVGRRKIIIMPSSELQKLTGVGVNRRVSALPDRRHAIRQRVYELATRDSIPDYELRSVRGCIENVKWLSPLQGLVLARLAERYLPKIGTGGTRPRTDETRPCNNPRRHRWSVTRLERGYGQTESTPVSRPDSGSAGARFDIEQEAGQQDATRNQTAGSVAAGAAVPEAAVDEHREALGSEYEVRPARKRDMPPQLASHPGRAE